jgi:hypothetical protein
MKTRQLWIIAGVAVIGFTLGSALAPSWQRPGRAVTSATGTGNFSHHLSGTNPDGEIPTRTRAGLREEDKKPREPRIPIPLQTVADIVTNQLRTSDIWHLSGNMRNALKTIDATEREQTEVMTLIDRMESDMETAERKHLKLHEANDTKIVLDNRAMRNSYREISLRTQDGIRSALPPDLAEILNNSIRWDALYPISNDHLPTLFIQRTISGRMAAWVTSAAAARRDYLDPEFNDDGTPIPADQVFDDRWKPHLKGLTLLPQNE